MMCFAVLFMYQTSVFFFHVVDTNLPKSTLRVLCNANFHSVPYRNLPIMIFLLLTILPCHYRGFISSRLHWFNSRLYSPLA